MNKVNFGKILMSASVFIYAFIPPLADLVTDTHVFHPDWPAHARVHTVWLLGITTTIGVLALYLLWGKDSERVFNTNLSAILSLCVYGSFFLSASTASLYGGDLTDQVGGIEDTVLGIELNLFVFSLATLVLFIGWWLRGWKQK